MSPWIQFKKWKNVMEFKILLFLFVTKNIYLSRYFLVFCLTFRLIKLSKKGVSLRIKLLFCVVISRFIYLKLENLLAYFIFNYHNMISYPISKLYSSVIPQVQYYKFCDSTLVFVYILNSCNFVTTVWRINNRSFKMICIWMFYLYVFINFPSIFQWDTKKKSL